jgi:serine/threonine-protein kinase
VYDYGIARDGTFYYVMELLDGIDLFALVDDYGPQPPERVVHLLRQACHSLHEAHERGLIHRDIKPANLFICRYGLDVDFVKVLDFGLVKPRETPGADLRLTHADALTGTPTYMAPEAILAPERIDGRADLYALGCVAYFLLSGHDVFQGSSIPAMLVAHAQQPPAPLAQRASQAVPPELDALVLACLAKNPNERPRTAEELSLRLAALGLEERWTPERARAWWATVPQAAAPGAAGSAADGATTVAASPR